MSKRFKKWKYLVEERRELQKLEHPPEEILIKTESMEDCILGMEGLYGFNEMIPGNGIRVIFDEPPFPDTPRNPFEDSGNFHY